MRTGRVLLALYLGAMVVVFVLGGLFLAFQTVQGSPVAAVAAVARHVVTNLAQARDDPQRLETEFAAMSGTPVAISLYDPDRRLIATTVTPPLPAAALDDPHARDHGYYVHRVVERGAVVALGVVSPRSPPIGSLVVPLAVLIPILVILVVVIARYVGAPLQRIAVAARRFGRGELTARARLDRRDELGEVGRAFDEMADQVTSLMTAQRELMANVSHELQTPLARIQIAVDLMLDGVSEKATELLPEISGDLAEVERLIEDVMTLARFDLAHARGGVVATPLRPEPTPIAPLVERAAARFRAEHPTRALVVDLDPGLATVDLDAVLVRRVIENLLENARKYSEPDTVIRLAACATADGVAITVADHGIGIDATDLKHVFAPFFRTDRSRSRSTGGVGLGLVLARRVVEAHGGTIRIDSTPHVGTVVRFDLPATMRER